MTQADNRTLIVGDIGGTNARFATVSDDDVNLENIRVLRCRDYPNLIAAVLAYLADIETAGELCLALPGPVELDIIPLVNNPWRQVEAGELHDALALDVTLLNDFTAQAHSLSRLEAKHLRWLRGAGPEAGSRLIVGPGTGLGVGPVSAAGEVLESEGGQMHFAPATSQQRAILALLADTLPRVVNETLVSGPGLRNLHRALQKLAGIETDIGAEEISDAARRGDEAGRETIAVFAEIFGAMCGDFALGMGASGGVYLSGGLMSALEEQLDWSRFLNAFDDKGAYRSFCERVPIALVTHPYPGLLGAAAFMKRKLPQS